jgi:AraC family transcriptional regulator of adaptative response / DNA-3-methyladenine glycosylase II
MFDLDSDPLLIANQFSIYPELTKLWEQSPGLRLISSWDPFETAIGTILGQGVSVEYATQLMAQLVLYYGEKVNHPITAKTTYLFPIPEILMNSTLVKIKTTQSRKAAIREFSQKIVKHLISLSPSQAPDDFKKALLKIKGIGPWSAEYISLRALGDTDAFPSTDLILKRAIEVHKNLDFNLIKPWRGYAAIYLWKNYAKVLSKKGGKPHATLL